MRTFGAASPERGWPSGSTWAKRCCRCNLCMIYPRWKIDAAAPVSYLPLLLWCAVLAVCWGLSRVYSRATRTKEPQRRDERRQEDEGEGDQTNRLSETPSQVAETGLSLRSSRLCGLPGYSPSPTFRLIRNLGRHLLFGLGCFTVTLFPVLGFFDMYFLMLSRVSDHFDYLPLTALVALAAGGLGYAYSRILAVARTVNAHAAWPAGRHRCWWSLWLCLPRNAPRSSKAKKPYGATRWPGTPPHGAPTPTSAGFSPNNRNMPKRATT